MTLQALNKASRGSIYLRGRKWEYRIFRKMVEAKSDGVKRIAPLSKVAEITKAKTGWVGPGHIAHWLVSETKMGLNDNKRKRDALLHTQVLQMNQRETHELEELLQQDTPKLSRVLREAIKTVLRRRESSPYREL